MQIPEKPRLTIAVAIATAGRRDLLTKTVGFLKRQIRPANEVILCPAAPEDADCSVLTKLFPDIRLVQGGVGLPAQRNAILAATSADLVVFFDDDFLPAPDFLVEVERLFGAHPNVVMGTGQVLADGISGPGLDHTEGLSLLAGAGSTPEGQLEEVHNAYGCNMIIRMATTRAHGLWFDENLPLYAWLEDVDFSRRLAPYGRIVKEPRLKGVHLGTKGSGRIPSRRVGYSQIANPIYLARKGTLSWRRALGQMGRNLAANSAKYFSPEPWVDRRGRLAGNLLAIAETLSGRVRPMRITEL